ncbi:MAG: hypothetical protein JWQ81_7098 [Amycolatopsis sp.]|uniref:ThuA domain-containing protein n=1 Tax=Amycolatopsis sp. TaxID=37632 RepID=UPI00263323B4|nr:ThuA domain-containing protein [Amycolatopsis sp.]MCU1686359.1 hypothetical protein [Amycolatopsis sp.]
MPEKNALVVRGGWPGHAPVETTDRYILVLEKAGYEVTVSDSLDSYLDTEALAATDLIVQCWTMGEITGQQLAGLSAAVRVGTGFAGWHGGIIDSFRAEPGYHLITGGQFVHHPKSFVDYGVRRVSEHPIVAGLGPFRVTTEQYWLHVDPGNEVLAVTELVRDPAAPAPLGTVPVTWVRRWGEGRVFVTALGHRLEDLEVPEVDTMITRGLAWATR